MNNDSDKKQLELILLELKSLKDQIKEMEQKNENNSKILIDHIEFINKVFNYVKSPLFYLVDKINKLYLIKNEEHKHKQLF